MSLSLSLFSLCFKAVSREEDWDLMERRLVFLFFLSLFFPPSLAAGSGLLFTLNEFLSPLAAS